MDVTCNVDFAEEGDGHIEFEVIKNSDVICTFENVRNTGTIKIIKEASGGDDTEFNFEVTGLAPDTDGFSETLTAGTQTPMDMTGPVPVRSGLYEIWEFIPDGWMHMDVTCNVEILEEIIFDDSAHVVFEVEKNSDVICTFENVRNMGTLKIIKEASGGDDTGFVFIVVGFDVDTDEFDAALTVGDQHPMDMTGPVPIRTGTYLLGELMPEGWMHMDVTCNVAFIEDVEGEVVIFV